MWKLSTALAVSGWPLCTSTVARYSDLAAVAADSNNDEDNDSSTAMATNNNFPSNL